MSGDKYDRLATFGITFGAAVIGFFMAFVVFTLPLGWLMNWDQPSMIIGTLALSPISTISFAHYGRKWLC